MGKPLEESRRSVVEVGSVHSMVVKRQSSMCYNNGLQDQQDDGHDPKSLTIVIKNLPRCF